MTLPNIATGKWVALTGTDFATYGNQTGIPATLPAGGDTGRPGIFGSWCSMGFDRTRNRVFCCRTGGHGDWAGNGAYYFDIDTLTWGTLTSHDGLAAFNGAGYAPLYGGNNTNNLFAASVLRCESTHGSLWAGAGSPLDTRLVTIEGLNTSSNPITEVVQLNDVTPVTTSNVFKWVTRISLSAPNTNQISVAVVRDHTTGSSVWNPGLGSSLSAVNAIQGPFATSGETGTHANYLDLPDAPHPSRPSSVHSYDTQIYLPVSDRYGSFGGIYWGPGNSTPHAVWYCNPTSGVYTRHGNRSGGSGTTMVWDPTLNLAWMRTSSTLSTVADTSPSPTYVTKKSSGLIGSSSNGCMVLDNTGRKLYMPYPLTGGLAIGITSYDISNPNAVTEQAMVVNGDINVRRSGGTAFVEGLGCEFVGGRVAIYGLNPANQKGVVYSWDPDTSVVQMHQDADLVAPPFVPGPGIWKRFFSPDGVHLLIVLSEAQPVWAYKVPWGGISPFRPTNLTARIR